MITLTGSDGRKQTLQLHIPAGIEDGKSLRLQGKGGAGVNGAPAGDLLICIHVAEKPGFTRKGADVYTTANIPFTTAVLGGEGDELGETGQCHFACGYPLRGNLCSAPHFTGQPGALFRPFPLIRNKSLNIAALVQKKDSEDEELEFAMVQVPSVLPRIVELPAGKLIYEF